MSHALPLPVQQLAARSLFQLRLGSESGAAVVGVGVFISRGVAVTADHNFPQEAQRGARVYGRVIDLSGRVTELTFTLAVRDRLQDAALLQCEDDAYAHFLEPHTGDADELLSAHMALCSFQSAIHEQLPEFSLRLGIFHATCTKLSTHKTHALYQSQSWAGDSGASLLLHDGRLVGIHLAVVNDLEQLAEQEQSLDEAVAELATSVRSLIAGTSHGCIALLAAAFPSLPAPPVPPPPEGASA